MVYESEELGIKFSLPDELTVREQLKYNERVLLAEDKDLYSRFWWGILPLLQEWECALIPEPGEIDLDTETDPRIARIVTFVGNAAAGHMTNLEDVPKNS